MSGEFLQKADRAARGLAPTALTLLLVLVTLIPMPLPYWSVVVPSLPLMGVYYWGVHRPDLVPSVAVFGIGLFEDLMSGTPFGFNALVLVVALWASLLWRRYVFSSAFMALWWGFATVSAAAAVLQWTAISLWRMAPLASEPVLMRFLLSLALFPVCAWLMMRAQRAFL